MSSSRHNIKHLENQSSHSNSLKLPVEEVKNHQLNISRSALFLFFYTFIYISLRIYENQGTNLYKQNTKLKKELKSLLYLTNSTLIIACVGFYLKNSFILSI